MAANSVVGGPIRLSLLSIRMKKIQSNLMGIFRRLMAATSTVHGPIWLNFELIRNCIVAPFTCKNEKYPIKNEDARMFDFSVAQGQVTL